MEALEGVLEDFGFLIRGNSITTAEDRPVADPVTVKESYFTTVRQAAGGGTGSRVTDVKAMQLSRLQEYTEAALRGDDVVRRGPALCFDQVRRSPRLGVSLTLTALRRWRTTSLDTRSGAMDLVSTPPYGSALETLCRSVVQMPTPDDPGEDVGAMALILLRGLCEDFPLSVWREVRGVAQIAYSVVNPINTSTEVAALSCETILLRSMLLFVMGFHEGLPEENDVSSSSSFIPPEVLSELPSIKSGTAFSSLTRRGAQTLANWKEELPRTQHLVSVVLSDVFWMWAFTPHRIMLSHYYLSDKSGV